MVTALKCSALLVVCLSLLSGLLIGETGERLYVTIRTFLFLAGVWLAGWLLLFAFHFGIKYW